MNNEVKINDLYFRPMIDADRIADRVAQIAAQLKSRFADTDPLFVCMLSGGFVFASDLLRAMQSPGELAFVKWSSYQGTASTGSLLKELPLTRPVEGRDVVVIEDIVETGTTMYAFRQHLLEQGARSVTMVVMLQKPDCLCCPLELDYVGFKVPDDFVVGYGMDYNGKGRCLPHIYSLVKK